MTLEEQIALGSAYDGPLPGRNLDTRPLPIRLRERIRRHDRLAAEHEINAQRWLQSGQARTAKRNRRDAGFHRDQSAACSKLLASLGLPDGAPHAPTLSPPLQGLKEFGDFLLNGAGEAR